MERHALELPAWENHLSALLVAGVKSNSNKKVLKDYGWCLRIPIESPGPGEKVGFGFVAAGAIRRNF